MADDSAEIDVAEAEAAEAKARAEAARARAARLRQRAQAALETDETETRTTDAGSPRRGRWSVAAGVAAVAVICGLLAASGYIAWQHHGTIAHRQRVAAFTAAAKQGVVNIMALDFEHVEDDIHRLLDSSTGEFKDDFEKQTADFIAVTKKGHVISKGTVNSAALESMGRDSAVVLVAATSYVTNSAGAKEEPRQWRLRVTVSRDGDQIKMSKLVYVP